LTRVIRRDDVELKPGELVRTRYLTHVETDGQTQHGHHADTHRLREEKQVFVVLVLGLEPLVINEDVNTDGGLDIGEALGRIGLERTGDGEEEE